MKFLYFAAKAKISQNVFWTSGTDMGCSSNYAWCSANKVVRKPIWDVEMPETQKNCVQIQIDSKTSSLRTNDCALQFHFICEVQQLEINSREITQLINRRETLTRYQLAGELSQTSVHLYSMCLLVYH
jgi:hypothetical protein